jgi:hypothetical protein
MNHDTFYVQSAISPLHSSRRGRWEGTQPMTILSALRDRLSPHESSVRGSQTSGEGPPGTVADAELPFAGYDRLDARKVIDALSDHSQLELEAVEAYERSHQSRERVLDKLRYMRGSEPLPGYDTLSVQEIVSALERAEPATIQRVRGYERKFANRPAVLEAVVLAHHRGLANRPASPAPAYQPMGGARSSKT